MDRTVVNIALSALLHLALTGYASKPAARASLRAGESNNAIRQQGQSEPREFARAGFAGPFPESAQKAPGDSGKVPARIASQLQEANKNFTYRGKLIHPLAVKDLVVWISDAINQPGPVAMDLNGTYDTNRYYGDYKPDRDGSVTIDLENNGYFSYRRLGSLKDNLQVLETWENGGGSGVFTNLLLVKFNIDYEYNEDGSRRYRLVMQRLGEIPISDRYDGKITLQQQDNSIHIGPGAYPSGEKIPGRVVVIK